MKLKHTLAALAVTTMAANAAFTYSYDANAGNPVLPSGVQDPNVQGWADVDGSLGGTDSQTGVIEGGQGAWQNLDGTNNNNPGYQIALSGSNYSEMFKNGFTLTARLRHLQGGQFLYVGGDGSNTAGGYAFPGDRRVGFSLGISGDDYTVAGVGVGGSTIVVTDGVLNSTYVRAVFTGDEGAQTGTFQLFNDDTNVQIGVTQTITAWANGNGSTDAHTGFASGSSGGDNRETYYREFTLNSVPEPSSTALLGLGGLALILRRSK